MIDVIIHPASPNSPRIAAMEATLLPLRIRTGRQSVSSSLLADVVIYFWTEENLSRRVRIGAETEALAKGQRLVSIRLAYGDLPRGLPDHPIVDLTDWQEGAPEARLQQLVEELQKADKRPSPPEPSPSWKRLLWRACSGLTATAIFLFLLSVPIHVLEQQNILCSAALPQPQISDFCGAWGMGGKPTREERVAWEGREPGSCNALREHIRAFEGGVFYERASAGLDARVVEIHEIWRPDAIRDVFSQSFATEGAPTVEMAQAGALDEGRFWAQENCGDYAASDFYRLLDVTLEVEHWDCIDQRSGHYCGFRGYRTCHVEVLERAELESCGVIE